MDTSGSLQPTHARAEGGSIMSAEEWKTDRLDWIVITVGDVRQLASACKKATDEGFTIASIVPTFMPSNLAPAPIPIIAVVASRLAQDVITES